MTMTHTQRARDAARANEMPDWMLPVDPAQEHADYVAGCASDLQNAYAHSRAEHDSGMAEIKALVAQGLHVVVMSGPAYCRTTDACIGERHIILSAHLSRAVAERRASAAAGDLDGDEADVRVFPLPERKPVAQAIDWTDEVPF